MSDLIERLRDDVGNRFGQTYNIRHEAADALEAKDKRIERMQGKIDTLYAASTKMNGRIAGLEAIIEGKPASLGLVAENKRILKRIAELEGALKEIVDYGGPGPEPSGDVCVTMAAEALNGDLS